SAAVAVLGAERKIIQIARDAQRRGACAGLDRRVEFVTEAAEGKNRFIGRCGFGEARVRPKFRDQYGSGRHADFLRDNLEVVARSALTLRKSAAECADY
ncbi:MAG: hypothetical protein VW547_10115, partial [Alphaproteobacteria bacterium]